jgi:RNA 2',3'-cyclic 3'-phosphodiesterase
MHAALQVQTREWLQHFRRAPRVPPPENLHVTLAFLGEVDDAAIVPLTDAVRTICAGSPPMRLAVAGCGAFPDAKRPRILWAGIRGEVEALRVLALRLREVCALFAPAMAGEEFQPHLTLARPRDRVLRPLELSRDAPVFGEWSVESVALAESVLTPEGARYTRREAFFLGRRAD